MFVAPLLADVRFLTSALSSTGVMDWQKRQSHFGNSLLKRLKSLTQVRKGVRAAGDNSDSKCDNEQKSGEEAGVCTVLSAAPPASATALEWQHMNILPSPQPFSEL